MNRQYPGKNKEEGFSLIELLIAMTVTLVVLAISASILAGAFNVRARENQKSDALSDAQRALNIMSREISNSGYGLTGNGLVAADSGLRSVRVRANLNASAGETTSNAASDRDEDVKYMLYTDAGSSYIVRLDINTGAQTMVLANRVDSFRIRYYADKVRYTAGNCDINAPGVTEVAQKSSAKYIVMAVCVSLPARGTPNGAGYQPASRVQLISDVTLRNSDLAHY